MTSSKPRRRKPQTPYANIEITHNGKTMTLRDWADELGIPYRTFSIRYQRGIRGDELFQPLNPYVVCVEYQGETLSFSEWARKLHIPVRTLNQRYHRGDRGDRLFRPLGDTLYARRYQLKIEEQREKEARRKALADALPPTFGKPTE
jgi:hypothetical protein